MLQDILTEQKFSPATAAKIDAILAAHDYDETQIVGILLEVQEISEYHYIPEEAAFYVAQKLPAPIARIYDIINFYDALSLKPRAKYPIQVCRSIVCRVNDGDRTLEYLKDLLGKDVGEPTYDGTFIIEAVPCFGACDVAPAIRINGQVYGHLDSKEKIADVLKQFA